jgi:hypothetical protein
VLGEIEYRGRRTNFFSVVDVIEFFTLISEKKNLILFFNQMHAIPQLRISGTVHCAEGMFKSWKMRWMELRGEVLNIYDVWRLNEVNYLFHLC